MALDVLVVDLGALLTVALIVWYFRLLDRR
jgi:hypothetical protein